MAGVTNAKAAPTRSAERKALIMQTPAQNRAGLFAGPGAH
jgi:hypothetical protein